MRFSQSDYGEDDSSINKKHMKQRDWYLDTLISYLREHGSSLDRPLEILCDPKSRGYGGNSMYLHVEDQNAILYDCYFDECEENGIIINRSDLIQIFETCQELQQQQNVNNVVFERNKKEIILSASFADKSEIRRVFSYRCKQDFFAKKMTDKPFELISAFLYEHRTRALELVALLQGNDSGFFGKNRFYMGFLVTTVFIFDFFDEREPAYKQKISKHLLIELLKTLEQWPSYDVSSIRLSQEEKDIYLTLHYADDVTVFQRKFEV